MSKSYIVTVDGDIGQTKDSFPVRISQTVAREIGSMAKKRQTETETLINEILERYVVSQTLPQKQSGADYLLSLAGIFDSGENNASENVNAIVSDFILNQ
ncbi:MAG: hypothetical protein B6I38_04600 [Anaerolineaceae bacterium 4572_5.1]|nr:MAG: hypothetical protein B6I38_04600 [Anaerolineaceae bacterium 4572_5.1]RLD05233.1 MAG: hypothetical protein DRI56_09990 [Chloroflexota bacterium]